MWHWFLKENFQVATRMNGVPHTIALVDTTNPITSHTVAFHCCRNRERMVQIAHAPISCAFCQRQSQIESDQINTISSNIRKSGLQLKKHESCLDFTCASERNQRQRDKDRNIKILQEKDIRRCNFQSEVWTAKSTLKATPIWFIVVKWVK